MPARSIVLVPWIALCLLSPTAAKADAPTAFVLDANGSSGQTLGTYLDVLEDPGGELGVEQVQARAVASRFRRSEQDVPGFG